MLPIFATGGKKKPKKKNRGKGKSKPAPQTTLSLEGPKTPVQQLQILSKSAPADEDEATEEMPVEIVEELVSNGFMSVMEEHFAKLYRKIENLKVAVSTLKTTVVSLVEENKKMGERRGNAPDPELQPPATPRTSAQDRTIRPRQVLPAPRKRVGTPLA